MCVGRLGRQCPGEVGAHLEQFLRPWCIHLGRYREDQEKASAFQGLLAVCKSNPRPVLGTTTPARALSCVRVH